MKELDVSSKPLHIQFQNIYYIIIFNTISLSIAHKDEESGGPAGYRTPEGSRASEAEKTNNTQARRRKRKLLAGERSRLASQLCAGYWSRLSFVPWPIKVSFQILSILSIRV